MKLHREVRHVELIYDHLAPILVGMLTALIAAFRILDWD